MKKAVSLVHKLFAEVFQTERSALRHPTVEADRLGPCPPADALRAVAQHAASAERGLKVLAERRGFQSSKLGVAFGSLFSTSRNRLADFMLTTEQSYRGTLLGMRHGCDLISLFGMAARVEGDHELASWCDEWLATRGPLVAGVANALAWFAEHPEEAVNNAKVRRVAGAA